MIPAISTNFIDLDVLIGQPVRVAPQLGREPVGWLVIWQDAPVQFHALPTVAGELMLMPSASARVRLVVL
ncbi:MAG: hypothetical protein E6Q97_26865 [Desulfurellales bacterium]|nr:MAG: hypothetical protein E6Q97_26865 [Desulfurellales bacterium]